MPGGKFYTPGDGGGAIQATYLEGDEIDVTFKFTAHHMGHVSLRLCDKAYVTQDCLDKYPPLERVAFETGELREAQPINPKYPELFYLSPKCYTDAQQGGEYVMTGRFKLPEGVKCDNCVLQMWWVSSNSCTPPGYGDGFHSDLAKSWPCVGDTGFYNPELGTCVGNTLGEEFWNCADISIASRATQPETVTTTTTTTPADTTTNTEPETVTTTTTTAAADTTTTTTTAVDTTTTTTAELTTTTTTVTAVDTTTTTTAELTTTTTRTNSADKRIVAYVPNWTTCPSAEQLKHYTHAMVAFAVTYPTWQQFGDNCATDTSCTVQPVPGCGGKTLKQMTDDLHAAGLKVILSFGGASMGGTWESSVDRCWDHCLDKAQSLVGQLEQVVTDAGVDGLDIDYEYFLDQAPQRAFLEELVVGLHARLHSKGVVLTHAPMDVDLCDTSFDQQCRSHYRDILRAHADKIDFIMPQFYNGVTRPTTNFAKANDLFTSLKVDMFGGDGSKVVIGICNGDCASTGSNANAAQALGIMQQLQSAHSDMGGMMFWDSVKDVGGAWSQAVYQYFRCDLGALSSKGAQQPGECTTDSVTPATTTTTTTTTTTPATTATTTPATTTTTTPATTATTPVPDGTCASVWQRCGGQGHQSRCCKTGSQCFKQNKWYSQCRPTCPAGWKCSRRRNLRGSA